MDSPITLALGLLCIYAALGVVLALVFKSRRIVPLSRRRPDAPSSVSTLTKVTESAVEAINKTLKGKQLRFIKADKFEQAGLKMRAADFVLICAAAFLMAGVVGFVIAGIGLGLLLAILAPAGMLFWLNLKASRRQAKFAEQLPDTLQMLAGSMRAGHSLMRAVDAASGDAEAPMSEELRRIVNETRIGRDLIDSLLDTAARMKSQDFQWTAQAIETQREIGGNLAEVLENVNETIRERAALVRQVQALSAEGRVSAYVLVGMPIVMLVILCLINPTYAPTFFGTVPGWLMLAGAAALLGVGSFWLSRLIKPKF
ncbi:type II secretion system F family protein [Sinomonas sp. JGH33]|uniref:Type II secretion system F family protein n=1 Tax=Sinomonas terricola TaxID=3110330 RepID=A0ABU5T1A4_9MICC|nr:type II secretion system F family protein [Sinomonas sp. JGH33]MEA5453428.1 type II secretion system F family protein [Sinomonas sp. JGH33]